MDNFLDVIIVRKKKGLYSFLYFLVSLIMVILGLIASMNVFQIIGESGINYMSAIIFVVSGGIAFLIYWQRSNLKIDFDISFTNGLVEIARVSNNIKRKEIVKFHIKNVEVGAPISSPNFNRYLSMKNIKKHNIFLNRDEKKFFLFLRIGEVSNLIIFEYNEELIKLMKQYNPRNIKEA